MSTLTITEFLEARISEDEKQAAALLKDLEGEVAESYAGAVDERGPFTPQRLLSAKMWAQFAGQSKWRNFAEGQHIAYLADPSRVLAECAAKRAIIGEVKLGAPAPLADAEMRNFAMHPAYEYATTEGQRKPPINSVLRALAAVYKDHSDYQEDWAL